MKLFYHFLIFVFVSLVLVACANLFAHDGEGKMPAGFEQEEQFDDSVGTVNQTHGPYTLASINYQSLLKGKRWTDNKCYYMNNFCLQNVQTAITYFGRQ